MSHPDRAVALALSIVWLSAGGAGVVFGVMRAHVPLALFGVLAGWYGYVWPRGAVPGRPLTRHEFLRPWRAR